MLGNLPVQDDFLESMAEAAKAIADYCGDRILYISIANNLSVDCGCDAHPAAPQTGDIGIWASLAPGAWIRHVSIGCMCPEIPVKCT